MLNINLALTTPQKQFALSSAKYPAIVGGLGSGKSQAGVFRLLFKMMEKKGVDGAYYMPSYDLIKLRAMAGMAQFLQEHNLPHNVNHSEYKIYLPFLGSKVIFRSYNNPERIVAYEVGHSIVDEIDTLPKDKASMIWRKVVERNRLNIGTPNTIGVVTTPDQGLSGFVYSKWGNIDPNDTEHQLIKASTLSNPYLPDDYVEQIRSNYDPKLAEMYISGEFVSLTQNKVYHCFDERKNHTDRELKSNDMVVNVSIDFNVGGCCSVVFVNENGMCHAVDEFVSHDTQDFIIKLKNLYSKHRIVVYPDASGASRHTNASQSDIDLISKAGFYVDAPASNPYIRDRINYVNGMLAHGKLLINTKKCKRVTEALTMQGYDDKGAPEKFDSHPSIDDWNDSLGYHIARAFPFVKNSTVTRVGGGL